MTGDRDVEAQLRRHLAAEADDLPFLLDADIVRQRVAEPRRQPWRFLMLMPVAAAVLVAAIVGQALLTEGDGTGQGGPDDWGPLAVMQASGGADALNMGTLRITAACVLLETAGGESELLVWPADRTRWDDASASVVFSLSDGSETTLRNGQLVSLGGGGDSTREGGVSADEWAASIAWVAPPDSSCPMETRWFVSAVVSPQVASPSQQPPSESSTPAQIVPLEPISWDSWQEAEDEFGWQLSEPTTLPAGFRLTALQSFGLADRSMPPDDIVASYTGPEGAAIAFWQTLITVPAAFSFEESIPSPPPDIELERIEIEGSAGYWMHGVAISDDAGNPIGWDRDVIVLEWQSGDVLYRLHAEGLELAALRAAAESLERVGG